MGQGWGSVHKDQVLLGSWETEQTQLPLCVRSFTSERKRGEGQGVRRETLGVGGWLQKTPQSNWQAHVCVAEMGKGYVAEGCRKYDGVRCGKGR